MRDATKEEQESVNNHIKSISQKAIIIPNETTNGGILKVLFPSEEWKFYFDDNDTLALIESSDGSLSIFSDWWNAPYKKEGDGE